MQTKHFSKAFDSRLSDIKKVLSIDDPSDDVDYLKKVLVQINELKEMVVFE